jgi:thiamine biosynthesis lipoprotein
MMRSAYFRACAVISAAIFAVGCTATPASSVRSVTGFAQGTTFSLQWLGGASEGEIEAAAERELERIDALLSNYRSDSTLERFNAQRTGDAIELPAELISLFALAKNIYTKSDGCFDPTVRPLVRAWGFDGDAPAVPTATALEAARALVGLDKLEILDATHARKIQAELEIDMASIGQGYTAGRLAELLERHGSVNYLAEIGGEIVARGTKPDAVPWRVGVENPITGDPAGRALRMPAASRTAVITSGSYRHYLEADGRRFGHIIDPRTGWAVEHGLLSVTVVGPDSASAAAWGTALLCLGPSGAPAVVERERLAALLWVGDGADSAVMQVSGAFAAEWRGVLEDPTAR